ncbi:hypothetical protein [Sporolactobacillus putidus]|uniref:Uncharacterized protein n=1 Tax=Sporolactobacillus putidus TaxID=492735 RepID=A0A917W1W1_9BACL|nr:hypothetical protein [Sporolactobacillus putidus]GGL59290.1 hypothetical protein GCM10007968_24080 [Sporolactobacillus putidus]
MEESEFEVNPPVKLPESVPEVSVPERPFNMDEDESFINAEASKFAEEEVFTELVDDELGKEADGACF